MGHGGRGCALSGTGAAASGRGGARRDVFAVPLCGYVLVTAMVWAIGSKATRNVGQGVDKDEVNKETKITQEIQRNLSFWSLWSAFRS